MSEPIRSIHMVCGHCPERTFVSDAALLAHLETLHPDTAREFNAKERKAAAGKGQAQKDGSFPIKNAQDLRNAIQAYGRSKNKAATKQHIIRRAKALGLTKQLPDGWGDTAMRGQLIECVGAECSRQFVDEGGMLEHASAMHTFDDIRSLVQDAVRDKWAEKADYRANPAVPGTYVWVQDIAQDWLVFNKETDSGSDLWKVSYAIADNAVTFGEPVQVRRKTVYEPVGSEN